MNFEEIFKIDVNDKTEKRKDNQGNELTYLSWAWAWAQFKKIYPEATYEIKKFENNLPYTFDEKTGYMVWTSVTAENLTYEMWLPVMNGNNKAMKHETYKYTTKYGEKTVETATMFDVNKAIMRCLTKNLAMFGLGLYIYAGEDLPENDGTVKSGKKVIPIKEASESVCPICHNPTPAGALKAWGMCAACKKAGVKKNEV